LKKVENAPDTRLSYSSFNLIKNCSQKYYNYKVLKREIDSDASSSTEAFDIGKCFHAVLEFTGHSTVGLLDHLKTECERYSVEEHQPMIHAMLLKYLKLHQKVGLKFTKAELELTDKTFIGFVDVIMEDDDGGWWVVDIKTAARIYPITKAKLKTDPQLNLYAAKMLEDLKKYGLKLKKKDFKGCRYRVTSKPTLRRKSTETYGQYVQRLYSSCRSIDYVVPKESLNMAAALREHKVEHDFSLQLRNGELLPERNLSYCDSYFRPCEYWSGCHRELYTEGLDAIEALE